jgi:hypothetical protein
MHKFLALFVVLAGCATAQSTPRPAATSLIGQWDNNSQMASAPETLKRPPVAGGAYDWLDFQHARFFAVDVPALSSDSGKVVYLVWRSNGPDGPVSRQRLWVFRTNAAGQPIMDFYAFKNPQPFEAALSDTGEFKTITLDDLTAYGPLCSLPVTPTAKGFSASIPATCAIIARSGRRMVLSARIDLEGDTLTYSEQGTLETGALAFKVPGGPPYMFQRLKGR